jgi:hypothetical protein
MSICLNPEVVEWARAEAADRNISTSRFIASVIRQRRAYLRAIERLLVKKASQLREPARRRAPPRHGPRSPRRGS